MSVQVWRHPKAEEDLLQIWLFVARDSISSADRLLDEIDKKCRLLADHPAIGPARREAGPDIRVLFVRKYLVLYRIRRRRVEIVRVVHGARDLQDLLS
jgi:toxin ParE1/3/4